MAENPTSASEDPHSGLLSLGEAGGNLIGFPSAQWRLAMVTSLVRRSSRPSHQRAPLGHARQQLIELSCRHNIGREQALAVFRVFKLDLDARLPQPRNRTE